MAVDLTVTGVSAAAGTGFAFTSDVFASAVVGGDTKKAESADGSATETTSIVFTDSAWFKGEIGDEAEAEAAVYGKAEAHYLEIASTSAMTGCKVTYTAGVPTYYMPQGASVPAPEAGWDDEYTE